MSGVRSIVVSGNDPRLSKLDRQFSIPVQFQRFMPGIPIKVHSYRTRKNTWILFAVSAEAESIDYRYSNGSIYRAVEIRSEWIETSQHLFEYLRTRFFDFDIMADPEGETILEVNPSPAPIFFERVISDFRFSARVIEDWIRG